LAILTIVLEGFRLVLESQNALLLKMKCARSKNYFPKKVWMLDALLVRLGGSLLFADLARKPSGWFGRNLLAAFSTSDAGPEN